MAKIHVLNITMPSTESPRVGSVRCIYHINVSDYWNSNVAAPESYVLPVRSNKVVRNKPQVSFGASSITSLLSTHPDFPTGGSATFTIPLGHIPYLNDQNITAPLRTSFSDNGATLSQNAAIVVVTPSEEWNIVDAPKSHNITAAEEDLVVVAEVATPESTLIANHQLAEVQVDVTMSEAEAIGVVAARVDNLYNVISSIVESEYEVRYRYYGVERNPS